MNRLPDVTLKMFGREYDLVFGREGSGGSWLMAVNKVSEACLPLTESSTSLTAVKVLDTDNIVGALEEAGVIKRIGPSEVSFGFRLCPCEIVHPELIERLARLDVPRGDVQLSRDGRSR